MTSDGVHVARFNNGTWSVTARGFAAVAANKMVVMIDGRTVYSPLFTGVRTTVAGVHREHLSTS